MNLDDPIGDDEPEDGYDDTDRIEERLEVLTRIVIARQRDTDRHRRAARRVLALRLLGDAEEFLSDMTRRLADLFAKLEDDD